MNALEQQIVSALAARSGSEAPRNSKLAPGSDRGSSGTPPQFQNRQANKSANVLGASDPGCHMRNPWPDRPRFSRRCALSLEAARALASRPVVVVGMVLFMATGLMNVARKGDADVKVVVHTLWPL